MLPLVSYDISSSDSDDEDLDAFTDAHGSTIRSSNVDKDSKCVKNVLDDLLSKICSTLDFDVIIKTEIKSEPVDDDYDDDYRRPLNPDGMVIDRHGYRDMRHNHVILSESGSSDESSCLSSGDEMGHRLRTDFNSDDSDYVFESILIASRRLKKIAPKPCMPLKTKGELSVRDLPNIEDLHISLPSHISLMKLGVITSIVDTLIVIMSEKNTPALDQDTLLFTEDRNSFGKVFEIFGPVIRPYYSVRFNNEEDIKAVCAEVSTPIFFAPQIPEYTHGIFAQQLQQMKGSDASWFLVDGIHTCNRVDDGNPTLPHFRLGLNVGKIIKDNNEPPAEALDFSDDEQERRFKAQRRQQMKNSRANSVATNSENDDVVVIDTDDLSSVDGDPSAAQNTRGRGRGRGKRQRGGRGARPQSNKNNHMQVRAWPPSSSQQQQQSPSSSNPQSFPNGATGDQNCNSYSGYTNASNVHNWMWMSEGVFRMPQPRFQQQGFGRNVGSVMPQYPPFPTSQQFPGYPPYPPPFYNNNRPP